MSIVTLKDQDHLLQEMFADMDSKEAARRRILQDMLRGMRMLRLNLDALEKIDKPACPDDERCGKVDCDYCTDIIRSVEDKIGACFPDEKKYWKLFKDGENAQFIAEKIYDDQDREKGDAMRDDMENLNGQ